MWFSICVYANNRYATIKNFFCYFSSKKLERGLFLAISSLKSLRHAAIWVRLYDIGETGFENEGSLFSYIVERLHNTTLWGAPGIKSFPRMSNLPIKNHCIIIGSDRRTAQRSRELPHYQAPCSHTLTHNILLLLDDQRRQISLPSKLHINTRCLASQS